MRMARNGSFLFLLMMLCLGSIAVTQTAGQIKSMRLLTADVGWVATERTLFWTTNGGDSWKDITPKAGQGQGREIIKSVFFLDSSSGWVLMAYGGGNGNAQMEVARTSDAGANWSVAPVIIPNLDARATTLEGDGSIDFIDALDGWLNLAVESSANFRLGLLLATKDGGKTWNFAPYSPGVSGVIEFSSLTDGWLAGGPGDQQLYVTHDGSKSWKAVSLAPPSQAGANAEHTYDQPPAFSDPHHGLLPVTYSAGDAPSLLALFATEDGGNTWHLARTLLGPRGAACIPSTTVDAFLISASIIGQELVLTHVSSDGAPHTSSARVPPGVSNVRRLSFWRHNRGWLQSSERLLATADGGVSWTDITPPAPVRSTATLYATEAGANLSLNEAGLSAQIPLIETSRRLGFHACSAPSLSNMSTWWTSSPFYNVGIYIGGASRSCSNSNLIAGWITNAKAQGWSFMPLWAGPQAPCACWPNHPDCTQYPHVFSSNPTQAQAAGVTEANSAMSAAVALGLGFSGGPGTAIYYDMEPYSSATCGAAVQAFIAGWLSQLGSNSYPSGVYGSPSDAQTDWTQLDPLPQNVWIAKTGTNSLSAPDISVWGLSPLCDLFSSPPCSPTDWEVDQRIHQYLGNQTVSFGGVQLSIDYDAVDATAAVSGTTRTYSNYSVTTIQDTAQYVSQTFPLGINDEGLVVGWEWVVYPYGTCPPGCTCENNPGATECGFAFTETGGTYSTFVVNGANSTAAYAVNNLGTIVGCWSPPPSNVGSACYNGFIMTSGGQPVTINYPGASQTFFTGINDSGQVVGWWTSGPDGGSWAGAFVYSGGSFTPITFAEAPGANIIPGGINGDGLVSGTYGGPTCNGGVGTCNFIYSVATGALTQVVPATLTGTQIGGINNNGQVPGLGFSGPNRECFIYDFNTGTFPWLPASGQSACAGEQYPITMNDLGQIVLAVLNGNEGEGYIATPQ